MRRKSVADRFWEKVEKTDTCWFWKAQKINNGYGHFRFNGKKILAHRMSWYLINGIIPPKVCVLHKCDIRDCVNPAHLFLGDHKINSQDMIAKGRNRNGRENRAYCVNGHEFNFHNTYIRKDRGTRECKRCFYERTLKYRRLFK